MFHCSYFSLVVVLVSRNQNGKTTRSTIKYFFEKDFQDRYSRLFQLARKKPLQRHDALTFGEYQTFYRLSGRYYVKTGRYETRKEEESGHGMQELKAWQRDGVIIVGREL